MIPARTTLLRSRVMNAPSYMAYVHNPTAPCHQRPLPCTDCVTLYRTINLY